MQRHSKSLRKYITRGFWKSVGIKYLIASILLAVPLYPKFPFIRVPGTFVSIRLEDFLIASAFVVWILTYLPELPSLKSNKIAVSIILFLGIGLVSLFSAIFLTKTVIPHIGILHWLRRIEYVIPFFIGYSDIAHNRKNLAFYFNVLIVVLLVLFIYGFGQKHLNWPIILTQNQEYAKGIALSWIPGSHINSTFAGHYDLATYLVLTLPIFITVFFVVKDLRVKLVLVFSFIMGLWLLTNAISRISIVSYLVSSSLSLFLAKKYKAIVVTVIISILFFSLSSNLLMRYWRVIGVFGEKVETNLNKLMYELEFEVSASGELIVQNLSGSTGGQDNVIEDRSTSIRLNVEWPRALRAFSKNPLLGTGYSSITLATDNGYLRLLGEVGLLGFFSFFLIFLRILNTFIKSFPLSGRFNGLELAFLTGVFAGSIGVFINKVFIDVFEASKFAIVFWLLLGMSVSLIKNSSYE